MSSLACRGSVPVGVGRSHDVVDQSVITYVRMLLRYFVCWGVILCCVKGRFLLSDRWSSVDTVPIWLSLRRLQPEITGNISAGRQEGSLGYTMDIGLGEGG